MDLAQPYIQSVTKTTEVEIVFDKFHVFQHLGKWWSGSDGSRTGTWCGPGATGSRTAGIGGRRNRGT